MLALVEWFPADGAYSACVQDAAPAGLGGEAQGPHRFYGRGLAWHMLADVWDVIAAANGGKKAPTHPRPGVKAKKKQGVSLFSMRPK